MHCIVVLFLSFDTTTRFIAPTVPVVRRHDFDANRTARSGVCLLLLIEWQCLPFAALVYRPWVLLKHWNACCDCAKSMCLACFFVRVSVFVVFLCFCTSASCVLFRYGIGPEELSKLLRLDPRVEVFIMFIGTTGQAAERLTAKLPQGRVYTILDTSTIPQILRQIFSFTMLRAKM